MIFFIFFFNTFVMSKVELGFSFASSAGTEFHLRLHFFLRVRMAEMALVS